jgi:hypothetical protein
MMKFELTVNIYRPLPQVFTFVTVPENDFYWQYGTLSSEKISRGEMREGTLFRTVGHFMGRRLEIVYEVTEFKSNRSYGFKSQSGPIDLQTLYAFEVMKGSTRISHSTQLILGEPFKSNLLATEKTVKKEYKENLALLKDVLESTRAELPVQPTLFVSKR